jgi:hypothetical protein
LTRMFFNGNSSSFTLPWLIPRLFRNIDAYRISRCYIYMALWHIRPKFTVRCGSNDPFCIRIFLQAFCFDVILHVLFHYTYETATVSTIKYPKQNLLRTPNFYTNCYKYAQYSLIQHQNLYSIWYKICQSLSPYGPIDIGLMLSRNGVKQ